MRVIKLEFSNWTAGDEFNAKEDCIWVDREGAEKVMEWYGAFYAGDDYTVYSNGKPIELDINGEWKHDVIDGAVINPTQQP